MSVITHVDFLKNRRTKIVATVGPASASSEMLSDLITAGVNVFRLNMSHGDHAFHADVFRRIRNLGADASQPVAILADLCGPKIRTGEFAGGSIDLTPGERVIITVRDVEGTAGLIPSRYSALADDVTAGDRILLDDGNLELRVQGVAGTEINCEVVYGGRLSSNKGINLPAVVISMPSLTDKDRVDAAFALELGVDFLALSFVRSADDIHALRELMSEHDNDAWIIAKIEKPEALTNANEILAVTDGIMVARGDLGVELPAEEVPLAQDQLIALAREQMKPVIVATQMLESMITQPRPTRAEVTDVSHAVIGGADAVMLSAETAAGDYPLEAVQMMDRIARQFEAHLWGEGRYGEVTRSQTPPLPIGNVMANAVAHMSRDIEAHGVMVVSRSGMTAATVSAARPAAPIVALMPTERVQRRMTLLWGVIPVHQTDAGRRNPNLLARTMARDLDLAAPGEYVLLVRGFHEDAMLNTPTVTILTV